ncbi:hypothetical protein [Archaeoglobus neptunius]|uniref:hypothetical protein n=1 Tax=Archaeoglobus neptunius TaxID=2798580 RepID=UPI0019255E47|nr:hypothetical protein [Archaeoglobus neptunius]
MKVEVGDTVGEFRVVAIVKRFDDAFILEDELGYYLVVKQESLEKVARNDTTTKNILRAHQRIERIVSNTLFLSSGKTYKFYFVTQGEDVISKLRHHTRNGLLEAAIKLDEGADLGDPEALADVEEVLYYKEFSKEAGAGGLAFGLGFPGFAVGMMVAKTTNGTVKVIYEEVRSYPEGYTVKRKEVPLALIDVIRSDKFDEVIDTVKSCLKRGED